MNFAATPLAFGGLGAPEILLILLVLVLLFGARKLPELARGSGRALRIFKAETKGLIDENDGDVDDKYKTPEQKQIEAARRAEASTTDTTVHEPRPDER